MVDSNDGSHTVRRVPPHVGWLIAAASLSDLGTEVQTALPCRQPAEDADDDALCPGHIALRASEVPPHIDWHCTLCKTGRQVRGWVGSNWDLRSQCETSAPLHETAIGQAHYALLRQLSPNPAVARATVAPRRVSSEGVSSEGVAPQHTIILRGTRRELDTLQMRAALAAAHPATSHRRRRLLGEIWESIEDLSNDAG